MSASYRTILLAAALLLIQGRAASEDIELFVQQNDEVDPPAVLFVIDNGANFSADADTGTCMLAGVPNSLAGTAGGMEQCALHQVIEELPEDSVRIGVMVWNDPNVVDYTNNHCNGTLDNQPNPSTPGGCLVYPIKLMDAANKAEILAWIRSWRATNGSVPGQIKGSTKRTGAAMQEAWAYYEGMMGLSGWDYVNDQPETTCNRYIIYIGNSLLNSGSPGDGGNIGPKSPLESRTGSRMDASPRAVVPRQTDIIRRTYTTSCGAVNLGSGPHENNGYYADEWARYINETHDITTYSIGVLDPARCQASYAGILTSMASVGGGKYFPTTNFDELVVALQTALSEMLAVNSVFASVSLPVSVNTQGTYLNQVYVGMFRPDEAARSRWHGNMKQYRLGIVGGALRLLDAQEPGQPAVSGAGTGFLSSCALSYWTPAADDAYWQTYKNSLPFCAPHPAVSNSPDGNLVEKGGQGYKLRRIAVGTRNMKTCNAVCGAALANFNDGNAAITKTLLGDAAMADAERTNLINWARGENNQGDEVDPDNIQLVPANAMRPSSHGDVLHSRPIAINYGSPDDDPPTVVVFYGGNDGVLRAVNGNRSADIDGIPAGREMWSFMAPEFYPYISQLRSNSQQIFFRGEDEADRGPRQEKPYGFDGLLTAYKEANDTWIYAGMRRGGRMLYAFDVSDITTDVDSPTLKWRVGCPNMDDDVGCTSAGIAAIGQTWSSPVVMKTAGYDLGNPADPGDDVVPKPLLIMGGGYDGCEDADPHTCDGSSKGNRIFVLDADTGAIIKSFDTDRAVAGDVFVVSNPVTGLALWAYAADLGGNVYRISGVDANTPFAATAPGDWTITKIASLGCSDGGVCAANRKFMYAPDVVVEPAPNSGTNILLIGSGDREKPTRIYDSAYATQNYFFMLVDQPANDTWLTDADMGNCVGAICLDALLEIERDAATPAEADLSDKKGWYLGLAPHEQVVTSGITVFGNVTFSTHIPTVPEPGACSSDLGTAHVYNVRYRNAAPSRPGAENRYEVITGGGLPPSPVAGQVRLDDGTIVPFIIGADPRSPLEGALPTGPAFSTLPKSITYWYLEKR